MVNITVLIGRIGKDGELRYTKDGKPVMRLRIATDGRKKDHTDWHTVTVWGEMAKALVPYATKGRLVFVLGSIHNRTWEDQNGNQHTTAEIIADTIRFLDKNKKNNPPEDEDDEFPY